MYLFDENISPHMIKRLQEFGEPFSLMDSVFNVFGLSIKDPELIPQIAARNLIFVTFDMKMQRKRGKDGHYFILKEHNLRVLFLPSSIMNMKFFEQETFFTRYWTDIHEQVTGSTARLANITITGKVVTYLEIYT